MAAPVKMLNYRADLPKHEQTILAHETKIHDLEATAVPIEAIPANPWQLRKIFDQAEIQILAESIAEIGLIQSIVLRRHSIDGHVDPNRVNNEIVAGERRLSKGGDLLRRLPRIKNGHPRKLEISDVASDHRHAMHKGRRRDECIAIAALVGHMQPGAALCYSRIDRQRAA
jgi:hypothetical protein